MAKQKNHSAITSAGSEAIIPVVSQWLYGTKDPEQLTADQKDILSSIASLVGTGTGALVGDGVADVVSGSQIGQTMVDNNGLLDYIPSQTPQKPNQPLANQIAQDVSNGKKSILNKTDANYLYQINTDANLAVDVDVGDLGELKITGVDWEDIEDGKRRITAVPVSNEIWTMTGTILLTKRPDGSYGVFDDDYDFGMHKTDKKDEKLEKE